MRNHTKQFAGFTLIELIVSITIVSMMLFLINRIFFDTTNAVSRGMATSRIIANARAIGDQLQRDVQDMVGPSGGGFLVILNKQYVSTKIRDARVAGLETTANVRSDQLCFVRRGLASIEPMTPPTSQTFSFTTLPGVTYGRVWYGHLLTTDANGTGPSTGILGASTDQDAFATNWTLGRQLLFFDGSVNTGEVYAQFQTLNWPVTVFGLPNSFYYATTEILNTYLASTIDGPNSGTGAPVTGNEILDSLASATRGQYLTAMKKFVFPVNRLRVNPVPSGTTFTSRQIAQMHPYFSPNTSDFMVEFAGDYDGVAGIDTTGGDIKWYDGYTHLPPNGGTNPFNPTTAITEPYIDSPATNCADRAFVWRQDDTAYWPYLIRIRYRLHDAKGELLGYRTNADGITGQAEPGKWFEVIINVNRN